MLTYEVVVCKRNYRYTLTKLKETLDMILHWSLLSFCLASSLCLSLVPLVWLVSWTILKYLVVSRCFSIRPARLAFKLVQPAGRKAWSPSNKISSLGEWPVIAGCIELHPLMNARVSSLDNGKDRWLLIHRSMIVIHRSIKYRLQLD